MKKVILIFVGLVILATLVYVMIPSGEDAAQQLDQAQTGQAKEATQIQVSKDQQELALSAKNTKIGFSCAKHIAGKTITVRGGWSDAFGSQLSGKAVFDPQAGELLQVEMSIQIDSLWSEHDMLTDALLHRGFFQVEQHPQATFLSTRITAGSAEGNAQQDATHQIEGNFSLNGITRSISFPARIELAKDRFRLHSQFSLQRGDFNVHFKDTAGFGLLTDENISKLVAMDVAIEDVFGQKTSAQTDRSLAATDSDQDSAKAKQPVDLTQLPPAFTETIPATQIEFAMVLVPGDAEKGIGPLYVEQHEVTWNEFMPWVAGRDLEDQEDLGELRAMKLRPSPPYGSVDRGFGMDRRPALGMSRLSAELYCKWISKQTGKTYRLPTEKEWEHVFQLGGGSLDAPPSEEEADRLTVYTDNSWSDDIDDWATRPVESTQPDKLKIYDLAGNVCEWVIDTGDERVVRGGHFDSDREELGVGRQVETADWNRDYPNEPKSIWWFVNARWVGFRVVCDAAEVEAGEAKGAPQQQEQESAAPAA